LSDLFCRFSTRFQSYPRTGRTDAGPFCGTGRKAGEGNVINVIGIFGLLAGIGAAQTAQKLLLKNTAVSSSSITNNLTTIINPWLYIIALWLLGIILLSVFKRKRYKY
jgi:hypothetical protein